MIPEEAVDAVYDRFRHLDITMSDIEGILEVAAPHMLAEAWEQGERAGYWQGSAWPMVPASENPYRIRE